MPTDDYVKREDIYPAVTEIAKEIVFGDQDDDKVVDIINSIPAADVEPVRHGRWVNDSDNIPHCSECEAIALQRHKLYLSERIFEVPFVLSKRCPECGAKMLPEPPKEGQTDE